MPCPISAAAVAATAATAATLPCPPTSPATAQPRRIERERHGETELAECLHTPCGTARTNGFRWL